MEQNDQNPRKLTEKDLPELANRNTSTEGTCCCYWKKAGAGWEQVGGCKEYYVSEEECRKNTPPEADAYSWSPYAC